MIDTEPLTLVDQAPLALLYHENSKLTDATAPELAQSIADFASDPDEVGRATTMTKTYAGDRRIDLSRYSAEVKCRKPLDQVLAQRRSIRTFATSPIRLAEIGAILEYACGVTGEAVLKDSAEIRLPLRAAPSAGALYPTETYLVAFAVEGLEIGVYHYHPVSRCLETVSLGASRDEFASLVTTAPEASLSAPALLVLSGRWSRMLAKYAERGYRNLLLDAGHLAQNILLVAAALDMAACPLAGFYDDRLAAALQLDPTEEPVLYAIMVGKPAI